MQRWFGIVTCVVWLFACDNDAPSGGAGESCTARDDCGDGLACVGQVCVLASQRAAIETGGVEGASCRARRDCQRDLICLDNSCQVAVDSTGPATEGRYSSRGESCQAKNDCAPDLACVMGNCRPVDFSIERTAKSCHRVECGTRADCCTAFVPNPNCAEYKKNCEADPVFCNSYRQLCECNQDCVDELCVRATPGCSSHADCSATSQQTPFCAQGTCVQCQDDSNCQGQARCNEGACVAACSIDENCPMLHACQEGICVEVGCRTDRECVFLTRDALAVCKEGDCRVPCDADADCANGSNMTSFQVCSQGECVFIGCDNDAECRALLGLHNADSRARAVCKED